MSGENDPKTFDQAEVDRIVAERLAREKGKYADYDTLKKAAEELADLKAKDQSELDREKAARAAAERERDEAKAATLRFEIAAEKGVKPRYINGSTREELEAAADEYLKDHPPADGGAGGGGEGGGGNSPGTVSKPAENLKGGGDPTSEAAEAGTTDPAELAKSVPRY